MSYYTDFWGGPAYQGRPYGYKSSIYTKGYHRGTDKRKLNATGTASIICEVPALSSGKVVSIVKKTDQGTILVVDTGRPVKRYESYSHQVPFVTVGTNVTAGQIISRTAGRAEVPGTSWSGPHTHFVVGDYADVAYVTSRNEYNADQHIQSMLASTTGGGGTSFPPPTAKGWDEMATEDEVKNALRQVLNERVDNALSIVPIKDDGAIYLFSAVTGRSVRVTTPYHVTLIQRVLKNNSNDTMLAAEVNIVSGYIKAVNPVEAISDAQIKVIADSIAKQLGAPTITLDYDKIATSVREQFKADPLK